MVKTIRRLNKFDGIYPFCCYIKKGYNVTFLEFKVTTPEKNYMYSFRFEPRWNHPLAFDYMYKQATSYFRSVIK